MYRRFFLDGPTDLTGMDGHFTPSHLWFVLFLFLWAQIYALQKYVIETEEK